MCAVADVGDRLELGRQALALGAAALAGAGVGQFSSMPTIGLGLQRRRDLRRRAPPPGGGGSTALLRASTARAARRAR
jgi:hypothetical protein